MKKKNKHKWKYRINVRKKVVVLIILGVLLFVGMGYAIINSNLGIGGTLEVSRYDKTLYGALKREVTKGYAAKYTGAHQDSMDSTKSIEDIYHYYGTPTTGADIQNRNNVVFADKCWQMIRTTDTGGVKLLYNGEPEITEVNGEPQYNCGTTRNLYHMGSGMTTINLYGTRVYAKNYTVSTSGTTTTFTLVDDPDDPDDYKSININSSNIAQYLPDIIENYPYTCRNATGTCTNDVFYKVDSLSNDTTVNAYRSTYRDSIGSFKFNTLSNTPATVGYMYGDIYSYSSDLVGTTNQTLSDTQRVLASLSYPATYKYSKALDINQSTGFSLSSPILGSDIPDPDYTTYYTYGSATITSGTQPYYIVAPNNGDYYYSIRFSAGQSLSDFNMEIGTDIVSDGNGGYIVTNGNASSTTVSPLDWYNNYASYQGKYTCGYGSNTCQEPRYIIATTVTNYTFMPGHITIAKQRDGLNLQQYVTINMKDWYTGYNTTYADYVYTCGNTDTVCTAANLRYIFSKTNVKYSYAPNHSFGTGVVYENDKFVLQNTIPLENAIDMTALSTHHYTCMNPGETECSNALYVYNYNGTGWMWYITLNDPDVDSISKVLDAMFTKNINDSLIKGYIDSWYEANLKDTIYEAKLDDVIYCNNRSCSESSGYTYSVSGWNDNGGLLSKNLYFRHVSPSDLRCDNVTDRFSVSNNDAKLTYKIALPDVGELNLLNNSDARKPTFAYWTMSANVFNDVTARTNWVTTNGNFASTPVGSEANTRPMIALISGTRYIRGTGRMTDPYVVDMSE